MTTMRSCRLAAASLMLTAPVLFFAMPAGMAQTPADFFRGKTIHLLIGYGVGGEDDLWARMIAKHMSRHIPGEPVIVPQNMPGAAGLVVANRLANASPKDGTTIGLINRGIPFEPLLGGGGTNFDPAKLSWIGSPSRDTAVCAARKDAAVQTMDDLFVTELKVGATGSGADTAVYPEFLSALLGMKFKTVRGYSGSREITLAMERNEVQGICVSYDSFTRSPFYQESGANILLQAAIEPDPRIKNVPGGLALAKSEEDRKALALFLARADVGRPFVAPPGVAADRLAALRQAFDAAVADPAFLDEAKAQNLNVVPTTAEQIIAIIANAYRTPADVVQRTIKAMGR